MYSVQQTHSETKKWTVIMQKCSVIKKFPLLIRVLRYILCKFQILCKVSYVVQVSVLHCFSPAYSRDVNSFGYPNSEPSTCAARHVSCPQLCGQSDFYRIQKVVGSFEAEGSDFFRVFLGCTYFLKLQKLLKYFSDAQPKPSRHCPCMTSNVESVKKENSRFGLQSLSFG